ncbi:MULTISPECIES: hypothetical protein [Serratia]|uniref:Uncharacterized protein n=1 Tax=Serratia marcescens TaxID=615 RepID=A0ABD5BRG1_SERMA|nr:hypothetical protein [Serratia marcescens]MDQ9388613.1 hypothetical protein [Serratia marcescens]MDQ9405186.1 hypothetical protein [Serratia marcescens]MDQ9439860.1 hypothetical protein [Serratia marcescens]MDQ9474310.1 hypothetical protein [Serratia marcescens]MDQ9542363.1 hypothetical protein [Serratia marcescens]
MNTQNVNINVNTATKEHSGRYGENPSALRTDGFVRNLNSSNAFDVIRADIVLARMEKQAGQSCGLHYEIFESRLLEMAMNYLCELPLKDRPVFMGAASKRGFMLTEAEADRAYDAFFSLKDELSADY